MEKLEDKRRRLTAARALTDVKAVDPNFQWPALIEVGISDKSDFLARHGLTDEIYNLAKELYDAQHHSILNVIETTYPVPLEGGMTNSSFGSTTPKPSHTSVPETLGDDSSTPRPLAQLNRFSGLSSGPTHRGLQQRKRARELSEATSEGHDQNESPSDRHPQLLRRNSPSKRRRDNYEIPDDENDTLLNDTLPDFDHFLTEDHKELSEDQSCDLDNQKNSTMKTLKVNLSVFPLLQRLELDHQTLNTKLVTKAEKLAFAKGCEQKLEELMDTLDGPIKVYGEAMEVISDSKYHTKDDQHNPLARRLRTLDILKRSQARLDDTEARFRELRSGLESEQDVYDTVDDKMKGQLEWSVERLDAETAANGMLYN
ncbi:hypothetical protein H2200_001181 [Cladophialophora chaetospira]|uniref:Uncharacterized protein n=1 Tax=Cladophialophora chaetospira TaxID=386627 RepID=A0AA38XKE5_9EURO|nr:hypothetical protein H2200_001181 [Cladophialophora chaetospira]